MNLKALYILTGIALAMTALGIILSAIGNAPGFFLICGFPLLIFFSGGSLFTTWYVMAKEKKIVSKEEYELIRKANARKVQVG